MSFQDLVYYLLNIKDLNAEHLRDAQRSFAKKNGLATLPSKSQILQVYFDLLKEGKIEKKSDFELLLRKRAIRSMSGIVSVQVLTKPYPCPSHCIFCPNDPEMPKSYIKSEPGAMRAWLNQFDPVKQVYNRLYSLQQTGHKTDKIEMIVLGGTWDFYPDDYKREFIQRLYDACNTFSLLEIENKVENSDRKYAFQVKNEDQIQLSSSLAEAVKMNEKAEHRIIGLTIETTPPFVTHANCRERREMWVTRIEMWVQSTDNQILEMNKRGHTVEEIRVAMNRLRQYGFKMSIHIMPGLYGSSLEKDIDTFRQIYDDESLRPDEIKFYPTSVIPDTELYTLYLEGKYQPITTEEISQIIRQTFREIIPPYTRIKRLIRDIPATEISAGSNVTNLSQLMHETLLKEYKNADLDYRSWLYKRLYPHLRVYDDEINFVEDCVKLEWEKMLSFIFGKMPNTSDFRHFVSLDTRSREMRNKKEKTEQLNLVVRKYLSGPGVEYFISFEDELGYLYGFTRLLLITPESAVDWNGLGVWTALIRELHIYWSLQSLKQAEDQNAKVQHTWLGKQLLSFAEKISQVAWYERLSVISGVWVREYYAKLGYKLDWTYMVKDFT